MGILTVQWSHYEKRRLTDQHYSKFVVLVGKLLSCEDLPIEAKDHSLKGEWTGFREFHVSGDLLVIYAIENGLLKLVRIGTHSELFK